MNKDFGEWYRLAGIEPNGEDLRKRSVVIDGFNPTREDVISLVKLFYGVGKPDDTFLSTYVAAFQAEDPAFRTRDNGHELSVIAGAQLVDAIERSEKRLADLAALCVVSGAAGNIRPAPPVKDIPEIAARYLTERAANRASADSGHTNGVNQTFFESLKALGSPHAELAIELQRMQRETDVVTEETNMLWWLFSEYSRDQKKRWTKIPLGAAVLTAGKELADLTVVLPGPIAALAFLDKIVHYVKAKPPASVSIAAAINELPQEWREQYGRRNCPAELEQLLPIGYGIKVSAGVGDNDSWLPAFTQGTAIAPNAELAPDILAYQIFIEALLCRSWKELK